MSPIAAAAPSSRPGPVSPSNQANNALVGRANYMQTSPQHSNTTASTASDAPSDTSHTSLSESEEVDYSAAPPPLSYTIYTPVRIRWITLFFTFLFIDSGLLPLILFYSLEWGAHLSTYKNLAIITSLVGTTSGCKIGQRTYLLWFRHGSESRRPIGMSRWGVDAFQYVHWLHTRHLALIGSTS